MSDQPRTTSGLSWKTQRALTESADSMVYIMGHERDMQLWTTNAAVAYQRALRRGEGGTAEMVELQRRVAIVTQERARHAA